MGVVHLNGPADAENICPFCLMKAKQLQWEMYQDEIQAAYKASGDKVTYIAWPAGLDKQLGEARYVAVSGDAPQLGLVRLCWDHVAGVKEQEAPSQLAQAAPVPAGLLRGRG
jgi:hypothetical protein